MSQKIVSANDAEIIKRMISGLTGMDRGSIVYSHSNHFKVEVFELKVAALKESITMFNDALRNAGAIMMSDRNGIQIWYLTEKWKDNIAK